jgi:hypothetical protein
MDKIAGLMDTTTLGCERALRSPSEGIKDPMSTLNEWHRRLEPMREFKELHERLDPMRGIKEAHWGLASVGELDRKLDPMRKLREQQERMDRLLEPMHGLMKHQQAMDRMLDPMRGLMEDQRAMERLLEPMHGLMKHQQAMDRMLGPMHGLMKHQQAMDRLLGPMRGLMEHQRAMERLLGATGELGEAHAKWDGATKLGAAGLADFALPRKASRSIFLTIIKRAPRVQARCQVCKRPVQVAIKPDGTWEVFSLCDCGALALDVARDVADAARRARRPTLTVLAGDRVPEAGPGRPIGQLRLVRLDESGPKDD